MQVIATLNGKPVTFAVENDEFLADTLRKFGISSVRKGCDTTCCGLCTVWLEGKPVLSCATLTVKVAGKHITTLEGVAGEAEQFAKILASEGAEQCGFCSPGFIMTVLAMKKELPCPNDKEIAHYLTGNLCRCTGYMGQLRAIKKYLEVAVQ